MAVETDTTATTNGGPSIKRSEASHRANKPHLDIIDIRSAAVELNLKEEIRRLFKPQDGPRKMPTLLLYDERGLQIFEKVMF